MHSGQIVDLKTFNLVQRMVEKAKGRKAVLKIDRKLELIKCIDAESSYTVHPRLSELVWNTKK